MDKEEIRKIVTEAGKELGYPIMKPEQLEVVEPLLKGRDVFAILPTGFGKSLCYACLPGVFGKVYATSKAMHYLKQNMYL